VPTPTLVGTKDRAQTPADKPVELAESDPVGMLEVPALNDPLRC